MRTFMMSLVGLVLVAGSAAVALVAMLIISRGFDRLADTPGPNARLFFACIAPFGVVHFGLLLERVSRLVRGLNGSAGEKPVAA